jgi:hypothetical protein
MHRDQLPLSPEPGGQANGSWGSTGIECGGRPHPRRVPAPGQTRPGAGLRLREPPHTTSESERPIRPTSASSGSVDGACRRAARAAAAVRPNGAVAGAVRPAASGWAKRRAAWPEPAPACGAIPAPRSTTPPRRSGEGLHVPRSGCSAGLLHPAGRLCIVPSIALLTLTPPLLSERQSSLLCFFAMTA